MQTSSSTLHSPEWHILGLGAIGGLIACRMQAAGWHVSASPSRHHPQTTSRPLTLEEHGTIQTFAIPVRDDTRIERLLLTTKAQQSEAAMRQIQHRLSDHAVVVVLQNGLGIQAWLSQQWPRLQIVAGTTTEGANRPTPQHIRHAGDGTTWLGPWRECDEDASRAVCEQWQALPMQTTYDQAIIVRLWEKLVMNCAINPLTALLNCRNGELREHSETRYIMEKIVQEVCALMQASGLPADAETLYQKVLEVSGRTGANISSMLQDQRAGNATEIAYINGFVSRQSTALGVSAPINQRLVELMEERRFLPSNELTTRLGLMPS